MKIKFYLAFALSTAICCSALIAQDTTTDQTPIFSGPQPGESLEPFTMKYGLGKNTGNELNPIDSDLEKPVVIVFLHKRTRPSFGLSRAIAHYCANQKDSKIDCTICMLTSDASETQTWMSRLGKYFSPKTTVGYSVDGIEGPGSYGLNRNVEMTILVGKANKVSDNFALVQPSMQSDGNEIIKAIATAAGLKNVKDISSYVPIDGRGTRNRSRMNSMNTQNKQRQQDPNIRGLLVPMIQKTATDKEVDSAALAVEEYISTRPDALEDIARISNTIVNSGKLGNYGTQHCQDILKRWAKKYGGNNKQRAEPEKTNPKTDSAETGNKTETDQSR